MCFLAATLVVFAGRQAAQFRQLLATNQTQAEKLVDLSEAEFVSRHLRRHGVAPYLLADSVAERLKRDIQTVQEALQCDAKTAVNYLVRGTVDRGPEPAADENASQ